MTSIKLISFIFCFALLSCSSLQDQKGKETKRNSFGKIDFDQAIAYSFDGNTNVLLIDSNGQISNTITKKVILTKTQLENLNSILIDSSTFGEEPPIDFYPHFGIIFFKKGEIVDYLQVSLMCSNIIATFDIPEKTKRKYFEEGLSKQGKERIYTFCKELDLIQYFGKEVDSHY